MSRAEDTAFPHVSANGFAHSIGLTVREYYAGLAMQGICANSHDQLVTQCADKIAEWAVEQADALIAELAKEKP